MYILNTIINHGIIHHNKNSWVFTWYDHIGEYLKNLGIFIQGEWNQEWEEIHKC